MIGLYGLYALFAALLLTYFYLLVVYISIAQTLGFALFLHSFSL